MKFILWGIAGAVSLALGSSGQEQKLCNIVEENDAYIAADPGLVGGISEATFNSVLDRVEAKYTSIVAAKGATLRVERAWDDGTVNAYASKNGSTWIIHMFGGLARHKTITEDGMILVACHELGHHLGGLPLYSTSSGMSNEGQADYYGNLKCFRQITEADDNETIAAGLNAPAAVQQACNQQYSKANDAAICVRASMAGFSVGSLFQDLRKEKNPPDFTKPDPKVISSTMNAHPPTQCRLDTYYNGALCAADYNDEVSYKDAIKGTCEKKAWDVGARPRCWFKFQ